MQWKVWEGQTHTQQVKVMLTIGLSNITWHDHVAAIVGHSVKLRIKCENLAILCRLETLIPSIYDYRDHYADLAPMTMNSPLQWQDAAYHFYCHFDVQTFRGGMFLLLCQMLVILMFELKWLATNVNAENDLHQESKGKKKQQQIFTWNTMQMRL